MQKDDYYCNEDLVKQLVFDAKLTTPFFKEWNATDEEVELTAKYNVSVRFIATSSGLTRWHYIFDEDKNEVVDDEGNRWKNSTEEYGYLRIYPIFANIYVKKNNKKIIWHDKCSE